MKRKLLTLLCVLVLAVCVFAISAGAQAQTLVLEAPTESYTATADITLDLNGCTLASLTVDTGVTVTVKDSATDDYDTVGGQITQISGTGKVVAADGYMQVGGEFPRVNMTIDTATVRPSAAGIYYKCTFEGNETVKNAVVRYGVALSIVQEPDETNIESCPRSKYTGNQFKAGAAANDTKTNSTVLTGILKADNDYMVNIRNSQLNVWGRAYIETADGYVFGNTKAYSLRYLTEYISNNMWAGLTEDQAEDLLSMYKRFTSVMSFWNVDDLKAASSVDTQEPLYDPASGDDLKLLAITSSFGRNTTDLLYTIASAEAEALGIDNEITVGRVYTSGCTLQKHVTNYNSDTAIYEYSYISNQADSSPWFVNNPSTNKGSTGAGIWHRTSEGDVKLVEALQDQEWDIIFVQQGAAQAGLFSAYDTYLTQLMQIIKTYRPDAKIVWNMTWAYGEECSAFPSYYKVNGEADQLNMYNCILDATKIYVRSRNDIDAIIPSGTTIQNTRAFYAEEDLLHTDLYHLSNLGKAFAGYTLYAVLTDQALTEINASVLSSYDRSGSYTLTDADKQQIITMVNTSIRTPYEITYTAESE